MLVLTPGRRASTERLVAGLWTDDALPARPAASLQVHASRLRKALRPLGATLDGDRGSYLLGLNGHDVDVERAGAAIGEALAAAHRGEIDHALRLTEVAEALTRGSPLAGLDGLPFADAARATLDEQRVQLLLTRTRVLLRAGDAAAAVALLLPEIDLRPWNEPLAGAAMQALHGAGRTADALALFERVRERLADELGVDPSPRLREVHTSILRDEGPRSSPTAATPVEQLPDPRTSFVGRHQDLAEVTKLLQDHRLVTVKGTGGLGKTRLALEVARRTASSSEPPVFVDLARISADDDVAGAVLRALSVPDSGDLDALDHAASVADRRTTLLVLDNAEHVVDGTAEAVARMLAATEDVRLLVTSRAPLHVPGEQVFELPAMSWEPDGDGTRLLLERAADAGARVDDWSPVAASRLVEQLEGLPLAIELAARRATSIGPGELVERLRGGVAVLGGARRAAVARHSDLSSLVDWSLDLLDRRARGLLERLSVLAGSFSLVTAEVAGDGVDAVDLVDTLVDQSLIRVEPHGRTLRYRLPVPVRERCAELLDPAAGIATRQDLVDHYCRWAAEVRDALRGPDQAGELAAARAELPNVWGLLTAPSVPAPERARLAACSWVVFDRAGEQRDLLRWLRDLHQADGVPTERRAELLIGLATLSGRLGDDAACLAARAQALGLATDALTRSRALCAIASGINVGGAIEDVLAELDEAVELADAAGDDHQRTIARVTRADVEASRGGDFERAARWSSEGVALARRLGDPHLLARALLTDAYVETWNDRLDTAGERATEALEVAEATGDELLVGRALTRIVDVRGDDGEWPQRILEHAREHGLVVLERMAVVHIAERAMDAGDDAGARRWLDRALQLTPTHGPLGVFIRGLDAVQRLGMGEPRLGLDGPVRGAVRSPFRREALAHLLLLLALRLDADVEATLLAGAIDASDAGRHIIDDTPLRATVLARAGAAGLDATDLLARGSTLTLADVQDLGYDLADRLT